MSPLSTTHISHVPIGHEHTPTYCPTNPLNPGQSMPRIRGCARQELTTALILCFLPLCLISIGNTHIPMHTPNIHPRCLHQSLRSNQILVDYRLRTARIHHRLIFTPLDPYQSAICPSWTGGGCRWASNLDHLADLHVWALTVEVSGLPTPPTLLP